MMEDILEDLQEGEMEYPKQGTMPNLPMYVMCVDTKGNPVKNFGQQVLSGGGSGAVGSAKKPTIHIVTLAANNTEYALTIPRYLRALEFQCRTAFDIKFAFVSGDVTGTDYFTLKSGTEYYKEELILDEQTIYFACAASAPLTVEVIVWE